MTAERGPAVLDGITLQILWNRIQAIAQEMGTTLHRTAFSAMVRESHDYSCVVMDAEGRGLGQSEQSIPSFATLLPRAAKRFLREIDAAVLAPGDVLISNDPWLGSTHLPDLTMIMPCFLDGRLVAFVGAIVHLPDVGGRPWSSDAREVYEEGIRLPLVYYTRGGEPNREVLDLFLANVRTPELVEGDLRAQHAALLLGERAVLGFLREQGLDGLEAVSAEIRSRADTAMAAAIGQVREGVYESRVSIEGLEGEEIPIVVSVTFGGGRVQVDFTGTAGQVDSGLNCVIAYTEAYSAYALKCLLDPHTPNNDGCYERFDVEAPEGTVLNPRFPAAVAARHFAGHALVVAIFRALVEATPDRVVADGCVPPWLLQFNGARPDGTAYALPLAVAGGQGAGVRFAGLATTTFPTNSSNIPIEVIEASTPLRFVEKCLVPESAGRGREPGGAGQRVSVRNESSSTATVSILADQLARGPAGILGGGDGAPGQVVIDGSPSTRGKQRVQLPPGATLTVVLPGGGACGPATN
ncbi:MAG TPA: hydantoinase B/oxoprolinase family protein [Gaiellaceae bacterium]|jgi:N-methylhydantoinase B